MITVEIEWADTAEGRHIMVRADNGPNLIFEKLCGGRGEAAHPSLPCPACREEMWTLIESTIPVTADDLGDIAADADEDEESVA